MCVGCDNNFIETLFYLVYVSQFQLPAKLKWLNYFTAISLTIYFLTFEQYRIAAREDKNQFARF